MPASAIIEKIIGNYIVDFYCAAARLVIEIDGSQRYETEKEARDAKRTAFLESYELMVLRFSNGDIDRKFRAVCEQIDFVIKERSGMSSQS